MARTLKVTVYDPGRKQSLSVTVYHARLEDAAKHVSRALQDRWRTTNLNSRRHKRRL